MTSSTKIAPQTKYTEEERDAIFDAAINASLAGNNEEADRLIKIMPIHPRWAKIIAEIYGKDFLLKYFNITRANELYGEGWLNGI